MYIWYAEGKKVADALKLFSITSEGRNVIANTVDDNRIRLCTGATKEDAASIASRLIYACKTNALRIAIRQDYDTRLSHVSVLR